MIPEGEELWKLLLVIALNKVRLIAEHHRALKRDVSKTQLIGDQDFGEPAGASAVLRLTIEDILETLPELHRKVVHYRIDGYEIAEIASHVSASRRSVERILQSFRSRLRTKLEIE